MLRRILILGTALTAVAAVPACGSSVRPLKSEKPLDEGALQTMR